MTQDDALASLRAAYDAANDALEKAQDDDVGAATVNRLNDAANFALRCLAQAIREEMTVDNQHTQEIQSELDAATARLKTDLMKDQQIASVVTAVDQVVKLAGALASAFA
jgi:hypothetical protein